MPLFWFKICFALLLFTSLFSCSSDDGKDGLSWATETANVIYSEWIAFSGTYTATNVDGRSGSLYLFNAPKIPQDIVDHGVVLAYVKRALDTNIYQVSYTIPSSF